MTRFFIIVLERIRDGRARRRSPPGRDRIDYEYKIDDIDDDDKDDDDDDLKKGETTSTSDIANENTVVSMIPDIDDIVSRGTTTTAADVDGGGSSGESYQSGEKTETIYIILAAATAGI